jgi:hypothetical protein
MACAPRLAWAQKVVAQVGSNTVYLGQPFDYQVRVGDVESAELQPFASDDFTARLRGQPMTQSSMTIVNGAVSRSVTTVFTYSLTAKKAGKFVIPAPVVKVGGQDIRGEEITIEVVGPTDSKLFKLRSRVVPPQVYPMQEFTVELQIELRALDKPYSMLSPVSSRVLNRPAELTVPWFADASLPTEVRGTEPVDLRALQTRDRSGFSINGMRQFSVLTFLPSEEKFKPETTEDENDAEDDSREWFRYTFKRRFFAERPGNYELGSAALQGRLASSITDNQVSLSSVFGVSDAMSVEVLPVPLQGRPDSWCGVIGDLDVQSRISPTDARVGQPLTLTLALTGTGSLNDAFAPDLTKLDEVNRRFRVYDSTSKATDGGRTFTYSLRAKEAGELEFPPIELSWFNPLREKFVTGKTSPIPLTIAKSEVLAPENIIASQNRVQGSALEATGRGLAANMPTLDVRGLRPQLWFATWGAIAALTVLTVLLTGREVSTKAKQKARRKRRLAVAERRFAEGTSQLAANDISGIAAIREAINGIVGAMSDSEADGMTTEETVARLTAEGVDAELVVTTSELLQVCDASRYGGLGGSTSDLQAAARAVVDGLMKAAKRMGSDA